MKKMYALNNDYLFKRIFREKENIKHLLKTFYSITPKKIKFLNAELIKDNILQKAGIVDLLLEIDEEIVILELQNINEHNFKERMIFYTSSIISKYCLEKGKNYQKLKPIKMYSIINYKDFNIDVIDEINYKRGYEVFTEKVDFKILDLTKVNENDSFYELASLFNEEKIKTLKPKNKINKGILEQIYKFNLDERKYKKMEDIAEMMMNEGRFYGNAYEDGKIDGKAEGKIEGAISKQNEIAKYNVPIGVDTLRRREPINCTQVEGIKSLKVDTNLWVL